MRITRALLLGAIASLAVTSLAIPALRSAHAASLVEVTNFGNNPGNMRMHIYVPDVRPASAAIVVAMHGCGGSGPGFYSGSQFASLADQYGFIVIYPTATQQAGFGNCFDTWSEASKRHDGGSDPVSIVSMVTYAARQHGGDLNRVYATGSSSGGMMTQHLLAVYPDVFKAGASFMGVPFGCFANAADFPPSTSQCTTGQKNLTPQQWGDLVRNAFPGYAGPRPRAQLWHGTNDTLVPFSRLNESIEQWTNVFGLSQTPTSTDTPQTNWTRRRYANGSGTVQVEAYSISGAGHSLPMSGMALVAVQFFGLTSTPPTTTSQPPTTTSRPPTTTSQPPTTTSRPPTTTSRPPTTSAPPTGGGGCSATYTKVNEWGGGFQGEVRVTNTGTTTASWTVTLTFANGQRITQIWNARTSSTASPYAVVNEVYNGVIPAGGSTTFGFLGTWNGTNANPSATCTRSP
jgi:poly(hydroxyalkanoate) depolymerase family esterase